MFFSRTNYYSWQYSTYMWSSGVTYDREQPQQQDSYNNMDDLLWNVYTFGEGTYYIIVQCSSYGGTSTGAVVPVQIVNQYPDYITVTTPPYVEEGSESTFMGVGYDVNWRPDAYISNNGDLVAYYRDPNQGNAYVNLWSYSFYRSAMSGYRQVGSGSSS